MDNCSRQAQADFGRQYRERMGSQRQRRHLPAIGARHSMSDIVYYTDDTAAAREEIVRAGGRVLHVLSSAVLIADMPSSATLRTCTTTRPEDLDPESARVADAWIAAQTKPKATGGIPWDTPGYQ